MGRMHAPGKGISSSAIVSTFYELYFDVFLWYLTFFLAIQKICPIMAKAIC